MANKNIIKIRFNINYKVTEKQELRILGNIPELGQDCMEDSIIMFYKKNNNTWYQEIELSVKEKIEFEYKYILVDKNNNYYVFENNPIRKLSVNNIGDSKIVLLDEWQSNNSPESIMFSSAFSEVLFKSKSYLKKDTIHLKSSKDEVIVYFKLPITRLKKNQRVAIYGSSKSLGNGNNKKAVLMENSQYPLWSTEVVIKKHEFPIKYKYCIVDEKSKNLIIEEILENRTLEVNNIEQFNIIVCRNYYFHFPEMCWKSSGVTIPVFSLRTKNSFGVGEILDIKLMIDWAKKTGLRIIQLLPINDTIATHTWKDSYPYGVISAFALHPIYLNLESIGNISSKMIQEVINSQGKYLNSLSEIDYEKVINLKLKFCKIIYNEQKISFFENEEFKNFFESNNYWLKPYAAFSYLRDLFGTIDFSKWGNFSKCSPEIIDYLTNPQTQHFDDIAIHYFIQYHLNKQMLDVSKYARNNGIVLKGDIPIGICKNSVDVWVQPELYDVESQAGAPPDDFSEIGQNWGFPTYNWFEMKKNKYSWWVNRLKKMSDYFDAYRLDHILGFFRIWKIPIHSIEGIMGVFSPAISININEISGRGIQFDYERFCKPYIREYMIDYIFNCDGNYIKEKYLFEYLPKCFLPKPEYDTQRKIEEHLKLAYDAPIEKIAYNEKIKKGLFRLLSEVLLFEVPGSNKTEFHPRHSFQKTYSYNDLDDNTKNKFLDLYNEYFYERNESIWYKQAMIKLPIIKNATNMLACGEDLGMVPKCVPDLMNELGILGMELQRMPKNSKINFGLPSNYPYLSVAFSSTHDTASIRGWWEENLSISQKFYNNILKHNGNVPRVCNSKIVKEIITQHFFSSSMFVIFLLQDLIGMDDNIRPSNSNTERIHNPSNPKYYWRYRMHINIEELIKKETFNKMIIKMVKNSGRWNRY